MNFEKAKDTYRKNALVQKQMAKKLVFILTNLLGNKFDRILEIGSGTGFLTDEIQNNLKYKEIFLNDLTDNFTNLTPDIYIKGDIISADIPNNLDLVVSNAAIQWIEDYDFLFKKIHFSLKYGGEFCFSTFGSKNFNQIKEITKIGLCYPDLREVIKNSGFKIIHFEQELETLYFENIKELLGHIKLTGVKTQNKVWTKADFLNFETKYLAKFKDDLGFELTYHPVFYILKSV